MSGVCFLLPIVLMALVAGGCLSPFGGRPDLERLYSAHAVRPRIPVIVIPGVFGSRLRDPATGDEIWPGSALDLLTGRRLGELALSPPGSNVSRLGDRLETSDLFFEAFGRDYYAKIVATLSGPGGYHCVASSALASASSSPDCVMLSWDWRRDLVEAAGELDRVVRRLRDLSGDATLRVDLVAHSAGGLVARYYLRFGGRDVLAGGQPLPLEPNAGADTVRRAILIGTPNYGSVSALRGAIMGNAVGIAMMRPEVLATMPSLFELFPNPKRTWMIDVYGRRLDVDLFDVEIWRRYRWSIFDPAVRERLDPATLPAREAFFAAALVRARRFHEALSIPLAQSATEYVVFGGDCELTPARCLLEEVDGRTVIRLRPDDVRGRVAGIDYDALMLEPGDGRVTKASLLGRDSLVFDAERPGFFPIAYAVFICRRHVDLPADMTFRDNLLNILLY